MTPAERMQREERRRVRAETLSTYAQGVQRLAVAIAIVMVGGAIAHIIHAATRGPF